MNVVILSQYKLIHSTLLPKAFFYRDMTPKALLGNWSDNYRLAQITFSFLELNVGGLRSGNSLYCSLEPP